MVVAKAQLLAAPGHVLKPRKPSAGERAKAAAAHRTATDGAPHHAIKSWPKSASAHNDATRISSAELRRMTPSESAALGLPARRTPARKSETPRTSTYTDPPGELVLGARHAGMYTAAQGGLSAVSVAHTWHAVMDGHPTAVAEEGIVTLHVGQPSKAASSASRSSRRRRAKQRHAEENLPRRRPSPSSAMPSAHRAQRAAIHCASPSRAVARPPSR